MTDRKTDAGLTAVQRVDMITRHMDVVADLVNRRYVEHKAWFQCPAPSQVNAGLRSAAAGDTEAAVLRYKGFRYQARASAPGDLLAVVALHGNGSFTQARDQACFTRGDAILLPDDQPFRADMNDCVFALISIPSRLAGELAEEHTGLPAAGLRFTSMTPLNTAARTSWAQTAAFICRQILDAPQAGLSLIVAQEMTRLAAATILHAFPNTTMTAAGGSRPLRLPPATTRRAAAYIEACAAQPLTIPQIAERAGVTPRALQYAFRRHYDTTITGYLRQTRLDRAHQELKAADPLVGDTVAAVAHRWGWANPASFAAAYRRRYGISPSTTLRALPR
ncbi:MAG TPA: AraC family transcriptional regulator [Streptosporangiaceae bacterium]